MKIVIDIDEKEYNFIKSIIRLRNGDTFKKLAKDLIMAVKEGTVIPEGHGDLIDRDVAYEEFDKACLSWEGGLLKFISPVIPADKEKRRRNEVD